MPESQAAQVNTFSHESVEYFAPHQFIEVARDVMGGIDLDLASCDEAQQIVRAKVYVTHRIGWTTTWKSATRWGLTLRLALA
jgi:hypothetical protein